MLHLTLSSRAGARHEQNKQVLGAAHFQEATVWPAFFFFKLTFSPLTILQKRSHGAAGDPAWELRTHGTLGAVVPWLAPCL